MTSPLDLRFVTSANDVSRLPDSDREVAVVGRSNVGKSSLLNAVANRKQLAHVSKTPGRTQLLNCFAFGANGSSTLVDLPGYGYAAVPGRTRATWQPMIEGYLLSREQLEMVLVLVDGEIGPTKLDIQMLEWLRANDLSFTVVASKHDKVKSSKRDRRKRDLADGCSLPQGDIVWTSASTGTGIDHLRGLIRGWLSA